MDFLKSYLFLSRMYKLNIDISYLAYDIGVFKKDLTSSARATVDTFYNKVNLPFRR